MKPNKSKIPPENKINIEKSLLSQNGKYYYLDVEELASRTILETDNDDEEDDLLHVQKYETYRNLIDVILTPVESIPPTDDVLGVYKKTPPSFDFKVAFNTLTLDKILKNYE